MRSELVAEILQCNTETNCWESKLFVTHSGTRIDISSAAKGRESTVPEAAPDQPATYPKNSKYRFDTRFRGLDAFNDLKETIVGQQCCPGCTIGLRQVHHTSRESIRTGGTWTFVCEKGRVAEESKHGQFMPGEYAMKNIATLSLKKRKTKGSTHEGVDGMYSKKTREKIQEVLKADVLEKKSASKSKSAGHVLNKRTDAGRAKSKESKCPLQFTIFHYRFDDCFYLSTRSELIHKSHPFLEPEMIVRSEKDLNEDDKAFMSLLYNLRASNTMIGRIMEHIKGPGFGSFVPKTIYNMNQKSAKMFEIAQGLRDNMTDAEKTLALLEV